MVRMQAKPNRSMGSKTEPSQKAEITVAETGSRQPMMVAFTAPISLIP